MKGSDLHKNQVLFTTEAPMGNVAQVPDNRKYILSQRTIAFKVDHNQGLRTNLELFKPFATKGVERRLRVCGYCKTRLTTSIVVHKTNPDRLFFWQKTS